MPLARAYHRPTDLDEALGLLSDPQRVPLAGGTVLNADRNPSDLELVDLQLLGLDRIETSAEQMVIGAMVDLEQLRDACNDPLIAEMCRRELPSTLRTLATVGGTVSAGGQNSVLLAAFLVSHGVGIDSNGNDCSLDDNPDRLITAVRLACTGTTAWSLTGRTPMDTPIVAAVGRRDAAGLRVAVTGVSTRPRTVDPHNPTADLDPPDDFRGSAAYRRHLVDVHVARVVEELS